MSSRLTLARKLDSLVVHWLVAHGGLPPWAEKARASPDKAERKIREATLRLQGKLETLFEKPLDRLAKEMERRGFPGSDQFRRELIRRVLASEREAFQRTIFAGAVDGAKLGRFLTVADLQSAGVAAVFDGKLSSLAERRLREITFQAAGDTLNRIVGSVDDVMATLAGQVADGLGIDEATRALRTVFDGLEEHRLQGIAQTEIISAQGWGTHQTLVEYGVGFKQWLTAQDGHVRTSHDGLHGVVIRVGELYPNGLAHPGDRSGPIEEWIRCRCRERPYIPSRGEIITTTPYYP